MEDTCDGTCPWCEAYLRRFWRVGIGTGDTWRLGVFRADKLIRFLFPTILAIGPIRFSWYSS